MSGGLCPPRPQISAERSALPKNTSSARDSTTGKWLDGKTKVKISESEKQSGKGYFDFISK